MPRVLRVGIAGYGVVGRRRRQFIDAHPRLRTVAVCDRAFRGARRLPDGARAYADYRGLLREKLDLLFVSLPNYLAPEVTISGLEKGLHVFCEKPPGRAPSDVRRVMAVERARPKLRLKYGFNHRYHESVRTALRIHRREELGALVNMRGLYGKSKIIPFAGGSAPNAWRAYRKYAGGGILLDQGIHMVDLMHLFAGRFAEVRSFVSNAYWRHDVEDNAYALLRDERGRVAMLHSTATQWAHRFSLELTYTQGFLLLRGILSGSKSYGAERLTIGRRDEGDAGSTREETLTYLEDNSWRDEIREFAECVLEGKAVRYGTSRDALTAMETVFRIYNADPAWRAAHAIEAVD